MSYKNIEFDCYFQHGNKISFNNDSRPCKNHYNDGIILILIGIIDLSHQTLFKSLSEFLLNK